MNIYLYFHRIEKLRSAKIQLRATHYCLGQKESVLPRKSSSIGIYCASKGFASSSSRYEAQINHSPTPTQYTILLPATAYFYFFLGRAKTRKEVKWQEIGRLSNGEKVTVTNAGSKEPESLSPRRWGSIRILCYKGQRKRVLRTESLKAKAKLRTTQKTDKLLARGVRIWKI